MGGIPVTTVDRNGQPVTIVTSNGEPVDWGNFVTKEEVAVRRVSGTQQLELRGEDLVWPNDITTGKLRLFDAYPESANRYYGFGIANGEMVYQVDYEGADHVFYAANTSDARIELFRVKGDKSLRAYGDLHMGEQKVVNMGDPTAVRDGVNLQTLNARLSAAQRTAIDALDPGTATVADVVNALQAV